MRGISTNHRSTWNLGKMLRLGFGSTLAIVLILSLFSLRGVTKLLSVSQQLIGGNQIDAHFSQLVADHLNWSQQLSFLFTDSRVNEVTVQTDPAKCNLGKWLQSPDRRELEARYPEIRANLREIETWHHKLHDSAIKIGDAFGDGDDLAKTHAAEEIYSRESIPTLERLQALLQEIRSKIAVKSVSEKDLLSEATRQRSLVAILVIACALSSIAIAIIITRATKRRISQSANAIAGASISVSSTAEQLQISSQSVADASSNQASSLEETAAAMEEISSQTEANGDKAREMSEIATESVAAVQSTREHLNQLTRRIQALSDGSKKIQHVVQAIDEIAFQTNILALNASVEAARAGEAGAGFAVVANEVRALAQRAAASAKETGEMIDESVSQIRESEKHVQLCYGSFDRVLETSNSVRELVQQVVESSSMQATGISQINVSLSSMDHAVQANASSAEEAASAAMEMSSLASNLEIQVRRLQQFVGGALSRSKQGSSPSRAQMAWQSPVRADQGFHASRN